MSNRTKKPKTERHPKEGEEKPEPEEQGAVDKFSQKVDAMTAVAD